MRKHIIITGRDSKKITRTIYDLFNTVESCKLKFKSSDRHDLGFIFNAITPKTKVVFISDKKKFWPTVQYLFTPPEKIIVEKQGGIRQEIDLPQFIINVPHKVVKKLMPSELRRCQIINIDTVTIPEIFTFCRHLLETVNIH